MTKTSMMMILFYVSWPSLVYKTLKEAKKFDYYSYGWKFNISKILNFRTSTLEIISYPSVLTLVLGIHNICFG